MEARFSERIRDGADAAALDGAEAEAAAALGLLLEEGRGRDAAAGRTLEGPHRSDLEAIYADKNMPARACSTGEQKALLISLCLANARALAEATGAAPILLMDEVAAHLDSGRRRALYDEIAALGAQAWLTGTAETLFEGLDARRIAVRDAGGASVLEAA
jgi:DNA replication and repair protein RecF